LHNVDSIARAIRRGNDFSDPFGEMSGHTAWMLPVIPYFLAILYWMFDDNRQAVVATIVTIQALVVLMTAAIVISEARHHRVLHLRASSVRERLKTALPWVKSLNACLK